jgi:hypothetical protein
MMKPTSRRRRYVWLAAISALVTVGVPALWLVGLLLLDAAEAKDTALGLGWITVPFLCACLPIGGVATLVFTILALTTRDEPD